MVHNGKAKQDKQGDCFAVLVRSDDPSFSAINIVESSFRLC